MPTLSPEERARNLTLIRSKLDHDLRSNMNVILGYCSMLKEELASTQASPRSIEDLELIEAAGQDLLELNDRIADLLAIQDDAWELARTPVELDRITDSVVQRISTRFPHQNIEWRGNAHLDQGDSAATGRLLVSIVDRLCRATSVPSNLEIELSVSGKSATIDLRCMLDAAPESEKRKMRAILEELPQPVSELNRIQDFDRYYSSIMCELAAAEIQIDVERLACRLTFPELIHQTGVTG